MEDRYVMIFDPDLCIGCNACAVECRRYYGLLKPGEFRLRIDQKEGGTFPSVTSQYVRKSCAHCENPVCIENCPTGATFKDENGFVVITKEKCIGCGACVEDCPYGARYLSQEGNEIKADKCSWCFSRVFEDEPPVCVRKCITGALSFGKVSESEIKKVLSRKDIQVYHPEYKTKPQLYHTGVRKHRADIQVLRPSISI